MNNIRFVDLFAGIGGFHYAINAAAKKLGVTAECAFSSDIDKDAQKSYFENFGIQPAGDITLIKENDVPQHDILLGGFPCQAFSIIGGRKGFEDARGTLFFDLARILKEKKPAGFVFENVKQLAGHDKGNTLKVILDILESLGYAVDYKVLNALNFGLPHKRERIFLVGWRKKLVFDWEFPHYKMKSLSNLLEKDVDRFYLASEKIAVKRQGAVKKHQISHNRPTIWHENKSGNISAYEYSCALRAGASYNYLLVNGNRRLTEREMLRLQGFSDHHKITHSYTTMRRFAGNSLPIPAATEVLYKLLQNNWINNHVSDPTPPKTRSKNKDTVSNKSVS